MGRLFDGVITASIRYRVVVVLMALALAAAGVFAAATSSFEVLPDFTPARVVVQGEAPGMGTVDVEEQVTRPLERALLGTPRAASVRSTSSPGLSVVTLMFDDDVDVMLARQLVAERVGLARASMPRSLPEPKLAPIAAPIGALLKLCLTSSSPDTAAAARELRTFAEWTVRPRLLAVPGIAQVTVHGGDVERVEVRPDPARMLARSVTLAEVTTAVERSQALSGGGFVDVGGARVDVQTVSRLTLDHAEAMLRDVVVAVDATSRIPVRLGDVADTVRADEPRVGAALYDGKPAIYLQIMKLPWADTLTTTVATEDALKALAVDLPPGARFEEPVFRQASFVMSSLKSVGGAMALGSLLVVVVLVAFLRNPRLAGISLTAIPLSILAAVLVLRALGVSINGMTLGGLAIAVGEVVDDAIIDVENVWRRLRENVERDVPRPALDVIREASTEVRSSVVYATIIVILVLVPVLLLGGIAGRIFSPLAQAYMLAILASLGVALTVTPALCAWLLPRAAAERPTSTRLARAAQERYRRVLRAVIGRPVPLFIITGSLAVVAIALVPFLGGRFLPEFHEGSLIAHVHAVPGSSLDEAASFARRIDQLARPAPAMHIAARAGRAELDEDAAPVNRIEMDFAVSDDDDREWELIVFDIAKRIGAVPGLGFVVEGFLGERVHEVLSGETAPVVVKVLGPDLAELRRLAAEVARLMAEIPGLGTIRVEPQIDTAQVQVRPDIPELGRHDLRPLDVGEQVMTWRQGRAVAQVLERSGRTVDIVVAGDPALRSLEALPSLPISTPGGPFVALSTIAAIDAASAPAVLSHDGGVRRISIGADAPGAGLAGAARALEAKLRELELPHGYRVEVSGEAIARREAAVRLLLIGGLVLLFIFALLTVAFDGLKDAGIVLLNFPLGLIGGVVAAALTPEGLSVAGFVGFVTLFGIIARNGILLVAHKRRLDVEEPDTDPLERIQKAAEERLLPIVMTALTAGLGLLPLALSFEMRGSELEAPMALIVCGGLVTSTTLNLLVLPAVYAALARREARPS